MTTANTTYPEVQMMPGKQIVITLDQENANQTIRIAGKVREFVTHLQTIRSTATRQLFYDAFGSRRNDSPLLEWVRNQAIIFTASLSYNDVTISETGATNE